MKIELDSRRAAESCNEPFFAIRLYPETNAEMAELEWPLAIGFIPKPQMLRNVVGNEIHYAIVFGRIPTPHTSCTSSTTTIVKNKKESERV